MTEKEKDIHLFILEEERRRNRERALKGQIKAKEASKLALISPQDSLKAKEIFRKETGANDLIEHLAGEKPRSYLGVKERNEIDIEPLGSAGSFGGPNTLGRGMRLYTAVFMLTLIVVFLWLSLCSNGLHSILEWATPTNAALQGLFWPVIIVLGLFQIKMLTAHKSSVSSKCNDTSHSSR